MKQVTPDYYSDFRCIADKCPHNCCIGWEIDIDDEAFARYMQTPSPFGDELRAGIDKEGQCFRLDTNERCSFLDERGLCRIYSELGEQALCQICSDHPRFRNFFSDRTETGLGLTCPVAAGIILSRSEPVMPVESGDETPSPEEETFFAFRAHILGIIQDRSMPYGKRVQLIRELYPVCAQPTPAQWLHIYRSLERMDGCWDIYLNNAPSDNPQPLDDISSEQLAVYFIFRHLAGALDDGQLMPRLHFSLHCVEMIEHIWQNNGCRALEDICRMYSSEIEYSDENISLIMEQLTI